MVHSENPPPAANVMNAESIDSEASPPAMSLAVWFLITKKHPKINTRTASNTATMPTAAKGKKYNATIPKPAAASIKDNPTIICKIPCITEIMFSIPLSCLSVNVIIGIFLFNLLNYF